MEKDNEIKLIEKTAAAIADLDMYLEKLSKDNLAKVNLCTKSKELVFWLTYYKDELESEEEGDAIE